MKLTAGAVAAAFFSTTLATPLRTIANLTSPETRQAWFPSTNNFNLSGVRASGSSDGTVVFGLLVAFLPNFPPATCSAVVTSTSGGSSLGTGTGADDVECMSPEFGAAPPGGLNHNVYFNWGPRMAIAGNGLQTGLGRLLKVRLCVSNSTTGDTVSERAGLIALRREWFRYVNVTADRTGPGGTDNTTAATVEAYAGPETFSVPAEMVAPGQTNVLSYGVDI